MKKFILNTLQFLAVASPIWLAPLGGYLFSVYGELFHKPPRSMVEPTVMFLAVFSFMIGLFVVALNTRKSIIRMIIVIIVYMAVASFVSFFSGWSGMLIGGYGN